MKGVYTLIIRFVDPCRTRIRKHDSVVLRRGLYVYTGSALGRGSTSLEARILRHLRPKKKEFWHIDRILGCESARVISVVFTETISKAECKVNTALLEDPRFKVLFGGIGSSDCRCESHFLLSKQSLPSLRRRVRAHYTKLGLAPQVMREPRVARAPLVQLAQSRFERAGQGLVNGD